MDTIVQKLFMRIEITRDCWLWRGYIHPGDGYGRFRTGKVNWDEMAHRLVYESLVKIIPKDMTIDHLCLNKICVKPEHLEVVSKSENSRRARTVDHSPNKMQFIKDGKSFKYTIELCKRGHKIEEVQWGKQRRACRVCHRTNNLKISRLKRTA